MPLPPQQQPRGPFQWGAGGSRLTPEDIMRRRAMAARQGQGDYSPVAHWTQGLGRVLDGLGAGLENRRLDKAETANVAANDEIAGLLAGGNVPDDVVMQALLSPRASSQVRDVAGRMWEARNAKPQAVPEAIQLAQIANDPMRPAHERQAAAEILKTKTDPFTTIQTRTGTFAGAQSDVRRALQGGGDPSGVPQTTAPPAEAVAELRRDPSGAAEFDEVFGQGASARILGGGTATNSGGGFP